MAIKGSESWDLYGDSNITDYFQSVGPGDIVPAAGRCGSAAWHGTAANGSGPLVGVTTSVDSGFVGFAYNPDSLGALRDFEILPPGSDFPQAFIRVVASGAIELWRGVNVLIGNLLATSATGFFSTGHYGHIGVEWKISTSGYLRAYVNGHLVVDTGIVNMYTAFTSGPWGGIRFAPAGYIDDLYWGDGDSSDPLNPWAAFLGDLRCEGQLCLTDAVGGGGAFREWTPSAGTDHGALLDENPPDVADFVQSGTVGQRESVKFPNITPTSGSIYAVKHMPHLVKDTFADRGVAVGSYVAATAAYQSEQFPAQTTPRYYPGVFGYNPVTGAPWTVAQVNSEQALIKISS